MFQASRAVAEAQAEAQRWQKRQHGTDRPFNLQAQSSLQAAVAHLSSEPKAGERSIAKLLLALAHRFLSWPGSKSDAHLDL